MDEGIVMYRIELVGGPYDGVPGMGCPVDDAEEAPPERIFVARCRGYGACGMVGCLPRGWGTPHVAWWEDREEAPIETVEYGLQSYSCERGWDGDRGDWAPPLASAVYVIGGLELTPLERERELVPAGASLATEEVRDGERAYG